MVYQLSHLRTAASAGNIGRLPFHRWNTTPVWRDPWRRVVGSTARSALSSCPASASKAVMLVSQVSVPSSHCSRSRSAEEHSGRDCKSGNTLSEGARAWRRRVAKSWGGQRRGLGGRRCPINIPRGFAGIFRHLPLHLGQALASTAYPWSPDSREAPLNEPPNYFTPCL